MVIDAGEAYATLATAMRRAGVPVFPSCDQAIRSLGRYICRRTAPQQFHARDAVITQATVLAHG